MWARTGWFGARCVDSSLLHCESDVRECMGLCPSPLPISDRITSALVPFDTKYRANLRVPPALPYLHSAQKAGVSASETSRARRMALDLHPCPCPWRSSHIYFVQSRHLQYACFHFHFPPLPPLPLPPPDGKRVRKWNVKSQAYGEAWASGDVIGSLIDLDKGEISFMRNGVNMGVAFRNVRSMQVGWWRGAEGDARGDEGVGGSRGCDWQPY